MVDLSDPTVHFDTKIMDHGPVPHPIVESDLICRVTLAADAGPYRPDLLVNMPSRLGIDIGPPQKCGQRVDVAVSVIRRLDQHSYPGLHRVVDILASVPANDGPLGARVQVLHVNEVAMTADPSETFRLEARECGRCPLAETRTRVVMDDGNTEADLLIIGEAPGEEEDKSGLPFQGRSGRVLGGPFGGSGLDRQRVYVANVAMCRPPANRRPRSREILACLPFLDAQLDFVRPKVVVALGTTATCRLLGPGTLASRAFSHRRVGTAIVIPTYHPASLNRAPGQHDRIRSDFAEALAITRLDGVATEPIRKGPSSRIARSQEVEHAKPAAALADPDPTRPTCPTDTAAKPGRSIPSCRRPPVRHSARCSNCR
jgi:uracil-DNA glycosylase